MDAAIIEAASEILISLMRKSPEKSVAEQIFFKEISNMEEKILLTVEETSQYLNIGKTKTRELMKQYDKQWVVHIGNRSYAHRDLLNKWLLAQVRL